MHSASPPSERKDAAMIAAVLDRRLSLAVVAEAPGLEDRRAPELGDRAGNRRRPCRLQRTARVPMPSEAMKLLLDEPVLARGQRRRVGPHRAHRRQHFRGARRHVFELVSDHLDRSREGAAAPARPRRLATVQLARHLEGGAVGVGAVDVGAQPEPRCGERQHAPELAAHPECRSSRRAPRVTEPASRRRVVLRAPARQRRSSRRARRRGARPAPRRAGRARRRRATRR